MTESFFDKPVLYLKGVGPVKADVLKGEFGIFTFGDLLSHYPFRYVDRTKFYKVSEIDTNLPFIQLRGVICRIDEKGEGKGKRLVAKFKDSSGELELVWFAGIRFIKKIIQLNTEYVVFGKPAVFNKVLNIVHPELEQVTEENTMRTSALQAVYPSTEKLKSHALDSRGFARIIKTALMQMPASIPEILSEQLRQALKLIPRREAIYQVHLPTNPEMLKKAELLLKFEELFYIQLRILRVKIVRNETVKGHIFSSIGNSFNDFYQNHLPFKLTEAQKRVLREIRLDVGSGKQMNRLLQGDVGSGKTLVALMSMLMALDNGFQASIMAPTEILARQHFNTIIKFLEGTGIDVRILTGSSTKGERKEIAEKLAGGELKILIGTHALLEPGVIFKNLGFVVIDEQHRFGVEQRSRLWAKNELVPHILIMTATPIPRTLAMTVYGDLDTSVIDELPPGRTPVKTFHYFDSAQPKIIQFIKEQIRKGRQIYIVFPLIEESAKLDFKNLLEGFENLRRDFSFPEYRVGMVHGRMKPKEKESEMQKFKRGETQILVSTTVIEVGVDVPNASVMIIESAERFGLSQLHQLRGRVGRGAEQSFCILVTGNKLSAEGRQRMETMVRTSDGFEIAEVDLHLRGHGDMEGTQQSGQVNLRLANLVKDVQVVSLAREAVNRILAEDPHLALEKNSVYLKHLSELNKRSGDWGRIG